MFDLRLKAVVLANHQEQEVEPVALGVRALELLREVQEVQKVREVGFLLDLLVVDQGGGNNGLEYIII